MGIIQIILYAIQYGPALFKIIKEILDLINGMSDKGEKKQAKAAFKLAFNSSRKSRDFKPLYNFHYLMRDRCKKD